MAKSFIKDGDTLDYLNGGTALSSGDVLVFGNMLSVALEDIGTSMTGSTKNSGVFDLPKNTSVAFTQGELVVWDASASEFQSAGFATATGDVSGGAVAVQAAGTADTTGRIKLLPGSGTVA